MIALLARTGGIISTRELRALAVDQTTLEIFGHYGSLQAVRQGWHCSPTTPAVVRLAWRFGGPLACVSALAFHDAIEAGMPLTALTLTEPLHVCLQRDAAPPQSPALLAKRWGTPEPRPPVIHWSSRDYSSGDRRAVSRDTALRQAARCAAASR